MRKVVKYFFFSIMLAVVLVLTGAALLTAPLLPVPSWKNLDTANLNRGDLTVTDRFGRELFYENDYVRLEDLPPSVKNAFICVEDRRFYLHYGVDAYRIVKAFIANIKAGGFKEGGSTITQQLIKNTHLTIDKTVSRKIQEIRISREAEDSFTKDEILEMYLNSLYFGSNIYGLSAAATGFFGVPATQLTIAQSATCAAVINSPANYSPLLNAEKSLKRRNMILKLMYEQNFISQNEYETALSEPLSLNKKSVKSLLTAEVIKEAEAITGLNKNQLYARGYTVKTYVDGSMQKRLADIVNAFAPSDCLASIVVLDNKTGSVAGAAANHSFARLARQPGSTIKPVLCFAPLLDKGLGFACSPVFDAPIDFNGYSPNNFLDKYYGWTTLEHSLIHSLNTPAVAALEQTGVRNALYYAKKCGLEHEQGDEGLDIALGGTRSKFTLTQLVGAYSAFANGGYFRPASYITEITDKKGRVLYQSNKMPVKAFGEDTAYIISDMLYKCAKVGTAKRLAGANVCAKTGTVGYKDGNTDAYCIAYSPEYTVGVWVGAKNGKTANSVSGGTVPAAMAAEFFLNVAGRQSSFKMPKSVVKLPVDRVRLQSENEVYLAGSDVPKRDCDDALFSVRNVPKKYSHRENYFFFDDGFWDLDFDNFKIIEGFFD